MAMKNEMRNKPMSRGTSRGVKGTNNRAGNKKRALRKGGGIAMKPKGKSPFGQKGSIVSRMEKADVPV